MAAVYAHHTTSSRWRSAVRLAASAVLHDDSERDRLGSDNGGGRVTPCHALSMICGCALAARLSAAAARTLAA